VEPGFGGQSFMADMLPKISELRGMIDSYKPDCELEVDGGIDAETSPLVKKAGANVLVAGSAVFKKQDRAAAISAIRNA
jgi:ribulose-phosphate 3-epimerase